MSTHVLIVDDDKLIRGVLCDELTEKGYQVWSAADGAEALTSMKRRDYDVIVTDLHMPNLDGVGLLRETGQLSPETEVIVLTAQASLEQAIECLRLGAFDFIIKGARMPDLVPTVARAVERRRLRQNTTLYQASEVIFSVPDRAELPRRIVEVLTSTMQADDASLMLPGADDHLYVAYSNGLPPAVYRNEPIKLGESIAGRVALRRKPVLLGRDVRVQDGFEDLAGVGRVSSSIVYPLVCGEQLLGVLSVNRKRPDARPFISTDLARVAVFASQVVLALEVQRLVQQLSAAERFAALGQLSSGIAHEINNPVAYVLANQDYALEQLTRWLPVADAAASADDCTRLVERIAEAGGREVLAEALTAIREAQEGTRRIAGVVRDMRVMARTQESAASVVDINAAVHSALRIAASEIRGCADLETHLGGGAAVTASLGALSQVFMNLVSNACHALRDTPTKRGKLIVTTRRQGDQVLAEVRDTGPGIPPSVLTRLFEPFFTTKGPGKGTGLGLALCRTVLDRHGGTLTVESTPGEGTCFRITLPAADAPVADDQTAAARAHAAPSDSPMNLRVLCVDDEPGIRRAYERALGGRYAVTCVASGEEALLELRSKRAPDVIICDFLMDGISGAQLYHAVAAFAPALCERFIFVSGSLGHPEILSFVEQVRPVVIEKPIETPRLIQAVEAQARRVAAAAQGAAAADPR